LIASGLPPDDHEEGAVLRVSCGKQLALVGVISDMEIKRCLQMLKHLSSTSATIKLTRHCLHQA